MVSTTPPTRRHILAGGATLAAGLVGAAGLPMLAAPARAQATEPESLGIPLREVNMRAAAIGRWPDDSSVVYVYSNGATGVFSVLDAETGQRRADHVVGDTNSFDLLVSADRTVYISTTTNGLFRYFPERDEVVRLGRPGGERRILDTVSDEDGVVYGGTYPNAHAFKYDPAAGEFFDYGPITEEESFLRNVAYDGNGTLYASTRPSGRLFALDVETGAKTEVVLPDSLDATNLFPVYITQFGLLFVRTDGPEWDWHVYDPAAGAWIDHIQHGGQSGMTDPVEMKTYFFDVDSENLFEYDLINRTAAPTSWQGGQLAYTDMAGIGLGVLSGRDHNEYPGQSVIGIGRTGRIWHYNPQTGAHRFVEGRPLGSPVGLHALALAPDGNLYMGGHLTTGIMARFVPATEQFEQLRGPQQVSGFANYGGRLYFSTYPAPGEVMEYDPSSSWEYGSNPRAAFGLGEGQDRARPLVVAGGRLAVGTQADSRQGFLDGELMFYDQATGVVDRKGAVISGHGVASLTSTGSTLVGGTTVNHLAAPPVDPSGELFIWDLATDELVWRQPVVPNARVICALTVDPDGHVWGLSSLGTVFEFDLATREIVRSTSVANSANGAGRLFFGADGTIYGSTAGTFADSIVFSLDVETMSVSRIGSGAWAAPGNAGRIYYTDGAELVRFTP